MQLWAGIGPGLAAIFAAGLLAAAFVRGYTGFGFSALFLAFASLFTNPVPLIPVLFLCEIAMTGVQARGIRGHIDWRRDVTLLIGAGIATPLSVWAMARLTPEAARLTVSGLILALSLLLLSGWQLRRAIGDAGHVGVGIVSGLANGAGVGGLPVAAFLTAQPIPASLFRGTLIVYLTGIDLMALPLMAANGLVSGATFVAAALAFPLLWLGTHLGGRRFLAASPQQFRRIAVSVLLVLSVLGIARALT
jgi:uncharacterized membrane protein YfcA